METGAPEGYSLNENKFDVELTEDYEFAKDNPIVIKVADSLLPSEESNTGVFGRNPLIYGGIAVAGVGIAAGAVLKSKKKKEEDSSKEYFSSLREWSKACSLSFFYFWRLIAQNFTNSTQTLVIL